MKAYVFPELYILMPESEDILTTSPTGGLTLKDFGIGEGEDY